MKLMVANGLHKDIYANSATAETIADHIAWDRTRLGTHVPRDKFQNV